MQSPQVGGQHLSGIFTEHKGDWCVYSELVSEQQIENSRDEVRQGSKLACTRSCGFPFILNDMGSH